MSENKSQKDIDTTLIDFEDEFKQEGLGQFKVQHIESIFDEEDFLAYATYSVRRF